MPSSSCQRASDRAVSRTATAAPMSGMQLAAFGSPVEGRANTETLITLAKNSRPMSRAVTTGWPDLSVVGGAMVPVDGSPTPATAKAAAPDGTQSQAWDG